MSPSYVYSHQLLGPEIFKTNIQLTVQMLKSGSQNPTFFRNRLMHPFNPISSNETPKSSNIFNIWNCLDPTMLGRRLNMRNRNGWSRIINIWTQLRKIPPRNRLTNFVRIIAQASSDGERTILSELKILKCKPNLNQNHNKITRLKNYHAAMKTALGLM